MNRLFRFAKIIDSKYKMNIFAEDEVLSEKDKIINFLILRTAKKLNELYNIFFTEDRQLKMIGVNDRYNSLIELKNMGLSSVDDLFKEINYLKELKLDELENYLSNEYVTKLSLLKDYYDSINDLILVANKIGENQIKDFLNENRSGVKYDIRRINNISRAANEALHYITKYLNEMKLKIERDMNLGGVKQPGAVIDKPVTTEIPFTQLNEFFLSDTAADFNINKNNWHNIYFVKTSGGDKELLRQFIRAWYRVKNLSSDEVRSALSKYNFLKKKILEHLSKIKEEN
jgi:hypothetical protein